MRRIVAVIAGLSLVGLGMLIGQWRQPHDSVARETVPLPLLLKQVQSLGDLHTAAYSYENVYTHETYVRPTGALAAFPGSDRLARAATSNTALVSADGTVEAGVDLSQAKILVNRIILPKARLYEPQVHARLHSVRRGLLWRDEGLAFGALNDAKERMAGAAKEGGILAEAERNAITQVQRLVGDTVEVEIEG